MKDLLEAGVHFGHQTRRWNPKMKRYIFGKRSGIYIIDLQRTLALFPRAADFAKSLGQRAALVCSWEQSGRLRRLSKRKLAVRSVLRDPPLAGRHAHQLRDHPRFGRATQGHRAASADEEVLLTKKETLRLEREREKMSRNLEESATWIGCQMRSFVVDPKKEHIAVAEANQARIAGDGHRRHQLRP